MIKAELIVEVDGREKYRGESRSLLQNFAKAIGVVMSSPGITDTNASGVITSTTIARLDGVSATIYGEWYAGTGSPGNWGGGGTPIAMNAADNDDSYGVVVGTGTATVTPTDYKLASQIPHGTGSGQLDYDTHTVASSYSSSSSYIEISRVFVNRSGSDVVVREVGLMARNYFRDSTAVINDVKFLIARDVLPSPVRVKNLGSLTVRYRIRLTL
jgi:hypothetical protein